MSSIRLCALEGNGWRKNAALVARARRVQLVKLFFYYMVTSKDVFAPSWVLLSHPRTPKPIGSEAFEATLAVPAPVILSSLIHDPPLVSKVEREGLGESQVVGFKGHARAGKAREIDGRNS